jgi:hypothetical protein
MRGKKYYQNIRFTLLDEIKALKSEIFSLQRVIGSKDVEVANLKKEVKKRDGRKVHTIERERRKIPMYKREALGKALKIVQKKVAADIKAAEERVRKHEALRRMDFMDRIDAIIEKEKIKAVRQSRNDELSYLAAKKMKQIQMLKTRSFESVLSFVPMQSYATKHNIYLHHVPYIIVTCIFGRVKSTDFKKFGNFTNCLSKLKYLTGDGWLEEFETKRFLFYVPTIKARTFFTGFNKFYKKTIEELINTDGWKESARKF